MKTIEEITEKLEQGVKEIFTSEKYKTYLDVMSKFYEYSANNCLLIAMQKPEATRVAGFNSWKNNFNRNVKKGEKAIKILAPIPHKYKKVVENENGEKEEMEIRYNTFRAVSVFDVSQTEGEALPSMVTILDGSVENFEILVKALENVAPVPVAYEEIKGSSNGYFSNIEKRIVIKKDLPEMQTVKTLIHEIRHAILHDKEEGEEKDANKYTKEVQAESVAYMVCNYLGMDTSDYSFGYVAGWSEGREAKELMASMDVIRKTAGQIIEKVRR